MFKYSMVCGILLYGNHSNRILEGSLMTSFAIFHLTDGFFLVDMSITIKRPENRIAWYNWKFNYIKGTQQLRWNKLKILFQFHRSVIGRKVFKLDSISIILVIYHHFLGPKKCLYRAILKQTFFYIPVGNSF